LGASSALNITGGATLDLGGTTQSVGQVGASGSGNGTVGNITDGTLNIQGNNLYFQSGTLTANLTSTAGSAGRLWIGGNAGATVYLGGVNNVQYSDTNSTIIGHSSTGAAGTVMLLSNTALGPASQHAQLFTGTLDLNGQTGVTVGSLSLMGSTASNLINGNTSTAASYGNTVDFGGGTPNVGGAGNLTLSGTLQDGSFTKIGAGTLTLSGASSYAATTVNAGQITIGNNVTNSGAFTVVGGTVSQSGYALSAASAVVGNLSNAYYLQSGGTNTVSGTESINIGAVSGQSGTGTYTLSGGLNSVNGILFGANNPWQTGTGTYNLNGGTLALGTGSITTYSSAEQTAPTWKLNLGGGTLQATGSYTIGAGSYFTMALTANGSTIDTQGNSLTIGAPISGAYSLTKIGSGTLTLSSANTYGGTTTISAGTLQLGAGGTTGSLSGAITDNATLAFNYSNSATVSNTIGGTGNVTLSAGSVTLSGNNSYTGATTVNNGTLSVNGSIASSSGVSVAAGATLGGTGTVSTISGAGLVGPGNSAGVLTATNVNPTGGLDFAFEFTPSGNDVLHLTGATPFTSSFGSSNSVGVYLDYASIAGGQNYLGGVYINSSGDFASSVKSGIYSYYVYGDGHGTHSYNGTNYYTIAEYDATHGGSLYVTPSTVAYTVNFGSGNINGRVMEFSVVPEPGTIAMLLVLASSLAGYGWLRRRGS
jgi:autotransporter-associated beta strand protein